MGLVRLTTDAGAWGPVSLLEAVRYARIDHEQDELQRLAEAATAEVERYSGHVLVPGTFRATFDAWAPVVELPVGPVRSVTSVTYATESLASTTVGPSTYQADLSVAPARISFLSWDSPILVPSAGLSVEFSAGYASPYVVPADIKQHVITMALLMFEHRDDVDALMKVRRYASLGGSAFSVVTL